MTHPIISIIVAHDKNQAIGKTNRLPWYIPEDLRRFKARTTGHVIIAGRKTYESLPKQPLPSRTNIVITHDKNYQAPGAIVVHSFEEALSRGRSIEKKEIFIIGGGQIFRQALPLAQKLYVTIVNHQFDADIFFPDYREFNKVLKREKSCDENYSYTFLELTK